MIIVRRNEIICPVSSAIVKVARWLPGVAIESARIGNDCMSHVRIFRIKEMYP